MLYFDTSYLVRLFLDDHGAEVVRSLAATGKIASSFHGRLETVAAFHRGYREKRLAQAAYLALLDTLNQDEEDGAFTWLPGGNELNPLLEKIYRKAPSNLFLRAGDALHLACARENGFREIYSHDIRMLAAAPLFGLKGRDVIK